MIENAIIDLPFLGNSFKTRLHEHGKEPWGKEDLFARDKWVYTGYMEGTEAVLTALKNSGTVEMELKTDDETVVLSGIIWGEVVNMYDEHFILHMGWKSEKSDHPKSLRGSKVQVV